MPSIEESILATVEAALERHEQKMRDALAQPQPTANGGADYIKVAAATKKTGISTRTFDRLIRKGTLRRYGSGRLRLLRVSELERYLANGAPAANDNRTADEIADAVLNRKPRKK
jgi:excisionase family DNA binding protein